MLARFGARVWIPRIMITWGIASTATLFASSPASLYIIRFLVGVAEAGFLPGVLLYLTYWFPQSYRARANAVFMIAMPVTIAFGASISGLILQWGDGLLGMAGWRWLFLVEGVPSIVLGVIAAFYLTSRPADAKWLTEEEKSVLQRSLTSGSPARTGAWREILGRNVLLLSLAYFGLTMTLNTNATWTPTIARELLEGKSLSFIGFVVAIPALLTVLVMPFWSARSDRRKERTLHIVLPMGLAALGWLLVATAADPWVQFVGSDRGSRSAPSRRWRCSGQCLKRFSPRRRGRPASLSSAPAGSSPRRRARSSWEGCATLPEASAPAFSSSPRFWREPRRWYSLCVEVRMLRREFLEAALCGCGLARARRAVAQQAERPFTIDFHAHAFVRDDWPLLRNRPEAKDLETFVKAEYFDSLVNIEARIAEMDREGVDVQVVSLYVGQYHYWAERELSADVVRVQNQKLAEMCAAHPKRLVGLGAVSLAPSGARRRAGEGSREAPRLSRVHGHRKRSGRGDLGPAVRSVLGRGTGARPRRFHSSAKLPRRGEEVSGRGHARQHRREPSRDDRRSLAHDLQRFSRSVSEALDRRRPRRGIPSVLHRPLGQLSGRRSPLPADGEETERVFEAALFRHAGLLPARPPPSHRSGRSRPDRGGNGLPVSRREPRPCRRCSRCFGSQ